jgi:hypothetical protein
MMKRMKKLLVALHLELREQKMSPHHPSLSLHQLRNSIKTSSFLMSYT